MRQSGETRTEDALCVALRAVWSAVNTTSGKPPGDLLLRGGHRTPPMQLRPGDNVATDDDDDEEVHERSA